MNIDFGGKTALVTGVSRGIGREIAKLLSKCNAKVIGVCRSCQDSETLKQEIPGIEILKIDLSDWNQTKIALEPFKNRVDLLVNNAGLAICTPLGEITEMECDQMYNVNVKAIINVTQCLIPGMKERGKGSIVNISSVAGLIGLKDHLVYGASKAAVNLMTEIMALELGPFGIRVNSVNPGVTKTDMAMVGWSDPARAQWMITRCPLGRFSEPREVAEVVAYLLSDHSSMVNALNIPVDGGVYKTKM